MKAPEKINLKFEACDIFKSLVEKQFNYWKRLVENYEFMSLVHFNVDFWHHWSRRIAVMERDLNTNFSDERFSTQQMLAVVSLWDFFSFCFLFCCRILKFDNFKFKSKSQKRIIKIKSLIKQTATTTAVLKISKKKKKEENSIKSFLLFDGFFVALLLLFLLLLIVVGNLGVPKFFFVFGIFILYSGATFVPM